MSYQWLDIDGRKVFRAVKPRREMARSDLPTPMIISDHIAPFKSMADGKVYDSKSAYYESLKRENCRIVEPGEYRDQVPD